MSDINDRIYIANIIGVENLVEGEDGSMIYFNDMPIRVLDEIYYFIVDLKEKRKIPFLACDYRF